MEIIKVKDLMERLKLSRQAIYMLRKKGMPYLNIGGSVRFDYEEVIRWIKRGE